MNLNAKFFGFKSTGLGAGAGPGFRRGRGLRRSHTWTAADACMYRDRKIATIKEVEENNNGLRRGMSFFCLVRTSSVNSVKQLVKFFELKMSEGRKTQVALLDDRRLEILIQPKLYAGELLDLVASHFNLKEKEFFGLSFRDDSGHHHWLQLDRKVLEHDFPKKGGQLVLFFAVRFFIESIAYLRDNATIELFYLQAKQSIAKGIIEIDSEQAFELGGYVLQASYGDFTDEETARKHLKKLPLLPTSTLKEHPSIAYCEEEVINYYRKANGQSRGAAIVNYMTLVERIPTYGIHYYEVKDKAGIPWWLGLSHKSIAQYDYADKKTPRREFAWKQLENLYFRDKKFSIEVHDPKRIVHTLSSFNLYEDAIQEPIEEFDELSDAISDPTTQVSVSRRTFGPGNVNVHAWFTNNPLLTKCIWSMAVSQHQFYLDRKQSKSQVPTVRSMSEIAVDLCQSTSSLPSSASGGDLSRSNSAHSLPLSLSTGNVKFEFGPGEIEETRAAQRDMYAALKARKEALEEALRKKTEELKALCLKEAEITGELPLETPLAPGEAPPQVRRRVGTEFSLSPNILNRDQATEDEELIAKLELEFEIQDKICKAALKLAHDSSVSKSVRKQRRQSYHKAQQKYKELEKKLNEARKHRGHAAIHPHSSLEDLLSEDSTDCIDSESEFISPVNSPIVARTNRIPNQSQQPQVKIITSPKVEVVELERPSTPSSQGSSGVLPHCSSSPVISPTHQPHPSRGSTPSPNPSRHFMGQGGYRPNSVYATRTQYRAQTYPTFCQRNQSTSSEYDNLNAMEHPHMPPGCLESPDVPQHNLYNVYTHQTCRYDSSDELKTPSEEHYDMYNEDDLRYGYPSKHGSLEGAYRKKNYEREMNRYGSVEGILSGEVDIGLPQLTPSRFGSKRESTADYRDSCYQIVDMPPLPLESEDGSSTSSHTQDMSQYSSGSSQGYHMPPPSGGQMRYPYQGYDESRAQQPPQYPGGGYGQQWYESGEPSPAVRQQQPPHTPQYEVPPTSFVQAEPTVYQQQAPPTSESPPPQQVMTVTKYQSYVEVSKPFETADVYRYSEKLRRQRNVQLRQQKLEAVLSGKEGTAADVNLSYVPYPVPAVPPHLGSPGSMSPGVYQGQGQGRPGSPYSVGSGSQSSRSSRPSSPYSHVASPPSPAGYPRGRSQYGVPSNIVQGGYPQQGQQGYPPSPHSQQRQVAYHPPQPMTCEPVADGPGGTPQHPPRLMNDSLRLSRDASFNFDTGEVAEAFSEEMLAWYEDRGQHKPATLV